MKKLALFATLMALLVAGAAFAADTNSKNVTLGSAVQVGSTVLQPGDYRVTWEGNGPNVNVNFVQGKKTLATAPAKLETVENKQTTIQMNGETSTQTLQKINFPKLTLDFSQGGGGTSTPTGR